jgi:hypothetical protein
MINKTFAELSTREKFHLQEIVKRHRRGQKISEEEQLVYTKFIKEFEAIEKSTKAKWPIIIGLLIVSLLVVLRQCM